MRSNRIAPFFFVILDRKKNVSISKLAFNYSMELGFQTLLLFLMGVSALMVVTSKNPVDSVLFLILVFLNAAGLTFLIEAEFIALIFIIIYVGAIAVLFLFIVMMLDIKIQRGEGDVAQYLPFALLLGVIFFIQIFLSLEEVFANVSIQSGHVAWFNMIDDLTNIELLGQLMYTDFLLCFLLAGILLLIAMIGAIILTLNFNSQRQNEIIARQLSRSADVLVYFR